MPIADAWMPTRWSAELAFGETYCTSASASSHMTPSPTRGAALRVADPLGERERAAGDHRHEALEHGAVGPFELAGASPGQLDPLLGQHGDRHARRTRPGSPASGSRRGCPRPRSRPRPVRPCRTPCRAAAASDGFAHDPTQSVWYIVWPVAGRTWPTTDPAIVGGSARRAADRRSRSRPACPIRKRVGSRCATWSRSSVVCSRTSSVSFGIGSRVLPIRAPGPAIDRESSYS